MKKKSRSFSVMLYLLATIGGPAYGQDTSFIIPESLQGLEKDTYRLEFDNDILFGKDSGLTSG